MGWTGGASRDSFSAPIDKMMFLGELSLDGSVRSVHGAFRRARGAEFRLKALAVPEAKCKEAAVSRRDALH